MLASKRLSGLFLTLVASAACSSAPSEPLLEEQLIVEPANATLSATGDSLVLKAVKRDQNGNKIKGCNNPQWRSQDEKVAIVRGNGRVVAKGIGTALIVATCETSQAAATVQVGNSVRVVPSLQAFPEAEGYGAEALSTCSRSNIRVSRVTNLDDSGPGSLRAALAQENGNSLTLVTFDVAGYIDLDSGLPIDKGCVYVAGQTAPGDGITLRGHGIRLQNDAHDVVLRYLRIRPGDTGRTGPVPVYVRAGSKFVLDHISVSWSNEKLIMISRLQASAAGPISRVTVQRSFIAEPLSLTPTGMNISGMPKTWEGATPPGWSEVTDITVHHNLFANSHHRNPNVAGQGVEVVNNVVYNWKQDAGNGVHGARADWVNNYLRRGPMFNSWRYEMGYRCEDAADLTTHKPSLHFSGNVGPRSSDPTADPWTGGDRMLGCFNDTDGTPLDPAWRRDSRLPQPTHPVTVQTAEEAYSSVLADVGADRGLRCDGTWRRRPDAVDLRVMDDVLNETGPSKAPVSEHEFGGFPSLAKGSACADRDADGLPDEYEARYDMDPDDPSDGSRDSDNDGYTNLEEFVNGSRPV